MSIQTDRLCLVAVTGEYTADIFRYFTSEVTEYMYPSPPKTKGEIQKIVECWMRQRAEKTDYVYAITLKETSEFLGIVGLHDLTSDTPELGIWTKIASHGNHYGREAIGGLLEYAKLLGFTKLLYPVDQNNIASRKIPLFFGGELKIGNKLVTTPDGRILYEEVYVIPLP